VVAEFCYSSATGSQRVPSGVIDVPDGVRDMTQWRDVVRILRSVSPPRVEPPPAASEDSTSEFVVGVRISWTRDLLYPGVMGSVSTGVRRITCGPVSLEETLVQHLSGRNALQHASHRDEKASRDRRPRRYRWPIVAISGE